MDLLFQELGIQAVAAACTQAAQRLHLAEVALVGTQDLAEVARLILAGATWKDHLVQEVVARVVALAAAPVVALVFLVKVLTERPVLPQAAMVALALAVRALVTAAAQERVLAEREQYESSGREIHGHSHRRILEICDVVSA